MTTAAIYARVSSARQKEEATIGSQTAALREAAERLCLDVPPEWVFEDEGCSGATLVRPALERLRDLAAQVPIDVVLCYSPDRLARRYAYQALLIDEFTRVGTEVRFVEGPRAETPEDELMIQFQGMIAEHPPTRTFGTGLACPQRRWGSIGSGFSCSYVILPPRRSSGSRRGNYHRASRVSACADGSLRREIPASRPRLHGRSDSHRSGRRHRRPLHHMDPIEWQIRHVLQQPAASASVRPAAGEPQEASRMTRSPGRSSRAPGSTLLDEMHCRRESGIMLRMDCYAESSDDPVPED